MILTRRAALLFSLLAAATALLFFATWRRLHADAPPPSAHVSDNQVLTRNPYEGLSGSVRMWDGRRVDMTPNDPAALVQFADLPAFNSLAEAVVDSSLAIALAPSLTVASRRPVRAQPFRGKQVPSGPDLRLTLDAELQAAANGWVECFTGLDLEACSTLPEGLRADPRIANANLAPRSPVAVLLVVERDSGRIVVLAGSVAGCIKDQLAQTVTPGPTGMVAVFKDKGARCAQLPDATYAWLLTQHPAWWQVPPGSTAKILAVAACLMEGRIPAQELSTLKAKIAQSSDNVYFKSLVLRCPQTYARLWSEYASPIAPLGSVGHSQIAAAAPPAVNATHVLDPATFQAMANERKQRGKRADRTFGAKMMYLYLQTQSLASVAIGGGGHTVNLFGIARLLRDISLRATGQSQAPPIHLVVNEQHPLPPAPLLNVTPSRAREVLDVLGWVTSSAHGGTASGACLRVMGKCPADGLGQFRGKSGTSDYSGTERSPFIKAGEMLPVKIFVGDFDAGGEHYVAAAMVFRGRDLNGQLELNGNAAAELVMLAKRTLDLRRPGSIKPLASKTASKGAPQN